MPASSSTHRLRSQADGSRRANRQAGPELRSGWRWSIFYQRDGSVPLRAQSGQASADPTARRRRSPATRWWWGPSIHDGAIRRRLPPGDVRGFDVRTGKRNWTFHTIPAGRSRQRDLGGRLVALHGNTNVWTPMSCDPELGYVYLPAAPRPTTTTAATAGENLFGESLVCLDARRASGSGTTRSCTTVSGTTTARVRPTSWKSPSTGGRIKAVAQVTKQGFSFVFDRRTGRPLWPIEERPVPRSMTCRAKGVAHAALSHQTRALRAPGSK